MKTLFIILIAGLGFTAYAQPDTVAIGTTPNDGTGDPLRTAFAIVNTNDDAAFDTLEVHLDTLQAVRVNVNDNADSLAVHLDTLQALRVDENNSFDSLAVHLDTLQALRVDENNSFDSLAVHLDTLQALRVDENNSFDSLAVHLDSLQAIRVDVNSNLDSIAVSTDTAQALRVDVNSNSDHTNLSNIGSLTHPELETMFQDTTKIFNLLSYGAVGDSTDATAALQAAIDAAGSREIFCPAGVYVIDSVYITRSPNIIGVSSDRIDGQSTKFISKSNKPMIYIDSTSVNDPYGTGGSIEKIYFYGSNNADSSNQHAIVINANKRWLIDHCGFARFGSNPIKLGDDTHAVMVTIRFSHFAFNYGTVINGRDLTAQSVNAIEIIDCHMTDNFNHCIDIIGKGVNIISNTFDFNDSTAIIYNARDVGEADCSADANNIIGNWFEDNGGGEIFINFYFTAVGPVFQYITSLNIAGNRFASSFVSYDKPEATAMITVQRDPDADVAAVMNDLRIGFNYYIVSNSMPYIDLGDNGINEDTKVRIQPEADVSAFYLNMGNAILEYDGIDIPHPTATGLDANGFLAADIHPVSYFSFSGDTLDITANPQIADAQVDGYRMLIVNGDADGYLKLDNGNGLELSSDSIYIPPNKTMEVMYSEAEDLWLQTTHILPYWDDITVTGTATIATLDYTPAHAAINFSDSATVIALTQNVWSKMTGPVGNLFVIREADGITVAGDTMTIVTDGAYEGDFGLSFDGTANDVFHVAIYKNGVVTSWEAHRKTSNNDTGNLGIPFYLGGLNAGDDISVYIRNTGDNDDATLISGQFIMKLFHPD